MTKETPMNALRFIEILQSYGAQPSRWPEGEREAMHGFAVKFEDAQTLMTEQAELDAILDTQHAPAPSEFLRARIMGAAAKSAPAPLKAANDRMPWRSVAAMLMIGIFTGLAAGQFSAPQTETGTADMLADNDYISDYDWLGETFNLEATSGG